MLFGIFVHNDEDALVNKGFEKTACDNMFLSGMFGNLRSSRKKFVYNFISRTMSTLLFFFVSLSVYELFTNSDIKIALECLHYGAMLSVCGFTMAYANVKTELMRVHLWYYGKNFFVYDGEEVSDFELRVQEENLKEIRRVCKIMRVSLVSAAISIGILGPLILLFITPPEKANTTNYFPVPFPYAYTKEGFILGFILEAIAAILLGLIGVGTDVAYVSSTILLRSQFKILNHSIMTLEDRALARFRMMFPGAMYTEALRQNDVYQDCMYKCLRENVRHHQVLIKFFDIWKSYWSPILFFILMVSSIFISSSLYQLSETSELSSDKIRYLVLLVAELTHAFVFCWYGELVYNESGLLLRTIFDSPWHTYKKPVKVVLHIMQTRSLYEIKIEVPYIKQTYSLETFFAVLCTAYSYFNLLRDMKSENAE